MSEEISAMFLIAEVSEFQSARFYNVYKGARISAARNVEETRNEIPAAAWKKYLNFASKNLPPYGYSGTFCSQFFL